MESNAKNDFQIGVECLVEANQKYWKKDSKIIDDEGWIYVLHTLHHEFTPSTLEDIVAKGVQEREHLPIASVISGRADELMELMNQVDASFGIEQRFHQSYYDYSSELIEELAKKMASDTYGDKDGLIGLEYRDIHFGDVLYDDILRRGNSKKRGDIFDCFEISQERYYTFIRNALAVIDQAYEMFEKAPPKYLVTMEYFYTKGLYAHVASALGARILIVFADFPDIIIQIDSNKHRLWDVKVADTTKTFTRKFLENYRANENTKNLFIIGSENKDKVNIPEQWDGRKTVFILPHAFGDAPRESCRHNIYHDYLEWFLDTLLTIRDVPDVNWVIKDHPSSAYYGQVDYVRSIFDKYRTENMYWLDKEYTGMSVKDVADCIVTCAGTAGIEYWAYGVPTIIVGEAYYSDWNIGYHMKTFAEYRDALKNIVDIKKPPESSSRLAQRILEAFKNWNKQSDCFSKLIYKSRKEEEYIWRKTGDPYGKKDSIDQQLGRVSRFFCEELVQFMQRTDLKSTNVFRLKDLLEF